MSDMREDEVPGAGEAAFTGRGAASLRAGREALPTGPALCSVPARCSPPEGQGASLLIPDVSAHHPDPLRGAPSLGPAAPKPHCPASRLARCSASAARALVPVTVAERLQALPVHTFHTGGERVLSVLSSAPDDPTVLRELAFISGATIEATFAPADDLRQAIPLAYLGDRAHLDGALTRVNGERTAGGRTLRLVGGGGPEGASSAPVPMLLDAVIHRAIYLRASDVHLESTAEGLQIRFRVDGKLQRDTSLVVGRDAALNLVRRVKVLTAVEFSNDAAPVEGAFTIRVGGEEVRVRVSVLAQSFGPKMVLRIVRLGVRQQFASSPDDHVFRAIGLAVDEMRVLLSHLERPNGVVLVTGPTGSGKSTLLYAALEHLNTEWRNIITLEDPVERLIPGINQIQIARTRYAEVLPLLLRQDPDVVMMGEIRDRETADAALTAGISGQLVLSSLHAGSSLEVLSRLRSLGASSQLIIASLSLVVATRLLPRLCVSCREEVPGDERLADGLAIHSGASCYVSAGCVECDGTGVRGRVAVLELLPFTQELRSFLAAGSNARHHDADSVSAIFRRTGFVPLAFSLRRRVLDGSVSLLCAAETLRSLAEQGSLEPFGCG